MLNPTFLQQTDTLSANSELREHYFSMQLHCSVVSLDKIKPSVSISLHLTVPTKQEMSLMPGNQRRQYLEILHIMKDCLVMGGMADATSSSGDVL